MARVCWMRKHGGPSNGTPRSWILPGSDHGHGKSNSGKSCGSQLAMTATCPGRPIGILAVRQYAKTAHPGVLIDLGCQYRNSTSLRLQGRMRGRPLQRLPSPSEAIKPIAIAQRGKPHFHGVRHRRGNTHVNPLVTDLDDSANHPRRPPPGSAGYSRSPRGGLGPSKAEVLNQPVSSVIVRARSPTKPVSPFPTKTAARNRTGTIQTRRTRRSNTRHQTPRPSH